MNVYSNDRHLPTESFSQPQFKFFFNCLKLIFKNIGFNLDFYISNFLEDCEATTPKLDCNERSDPFLESQKFQVLFQNCTFKLEMISDKLNDIIQRGVAYINLKIMSTQ